MDTLAILFIVLTSMAKPDNDLRDFADKIHDGRRQHLSSTDGFDSFNSKSCPFLFAIDSIDESGDEIKISGLATLPIVVTMPHDLFVDGAEHVHRFNGVYKNGVFNVTLQHRFEHHGDSVSITLNGKLENGRCRGYFVDAWKKADGSHVEYGGIFDIDKTK